MPSVIRGGRRPKSGIAYTCMSSDLLGNSLENRMRCWGTVLSGNGLMTGRITRVFHWTQVYGYSDAHWLRISIACLSPLLN